MLSRQKKRNVQLTTDNRTKSTPVSHTETAPHSTLLTNAVMYSHTETAPHSTLLTNAVIYSHTETAPHSTLLTNAVMYNKPQKVAKLLFTNVHTIFTQFLLNILLFLF